MDRYAKLWASQKSTSSSSEPTVDNEDERTHPVVRQPVVNARSVLEEPVDVCNLPADPAQRRPISLFKTAKVRDDVRRAYLQKGPFQPKNHSFPQTDMSGVSRHFNPAWFSKYGGWLETAKVRDDWTYSC
jgi:hypothetical protein